MTNSVKQANTMETAVPIVAVAPMMDWTDRHCRYLLRQISQHVLLYTEMVTTGAILHGDRARFLRHDPCEHPLALQLGGSEPQQLAECSRIGEDAGYDEINLNVGCPSDRVQSGRYGACLMAEPALVADCIMAMGQAVSVPVTVKTRIGIDDRDSYEELAHFVECVQQAGCETFIIHARKAFLQGLSPKENRTVPPLNYAFACRIKQQFPELCIVINGGITDLDAAARHLTAVDGVMLGRSAYHNPYILAEVDRRLFHDSRPVPSRKDIVQRMLPYIERELNQGTPLKHITRHMLGLFQGMPGARHWRRQLSECGPRPGAGIEVLTRALQQLAEFGNMHTIMSNDCQIHG
ncbi:MAG: tRNA dihydrouridine(20/20a) synthase DusA [Gammaproteobacteria bacterium]